MPIIQTEQEYAPDGTIRCRKFRKMDDEGQPIETHEFIFYKDHVRYYHTEFRDDYHTDTWGVPTPCRAPGAGMSVHLTLHEYVEMTSNLK